MTDVVLTHLHMDHCGGLLVDGVRERLRPDLRIHLAAMTSLEEYLRDCGLEKPLLHLVKLRASQINGCTFCINMHWKDARAVGESEQRLYGLTAWRNVPYYTDRERAALKWTDALTNIPHGCVTDAIYDAVRGHFTEKELADLTWAVAAINA